MSEACVQKETGAMARPAVHPCDWTKAVTGVLRQLGGTFCHPEVVQT